MILPGDKEMKEIRGSFFASPATAWDPKLGYRWNTGENRILRVAHGEIVFERKYKFNNYGQNCTFDYTPGKKSKAIYRFIVLGDSFTNDLMSHTAWPETLHYLLNSRKEFGMEFEVYSFPTDGGGLVNWHATFMELIDPGFDYDALIIAGWGDDLAREWIMMDCSETEFRYLRLDKNRKPETREQFEALLPHAQVLADIKGEEWIEAVAAKLKKNKESKPMTPSDYFDGTREITAALPPENYRFSKEAFIEKYGETRYLMLQEIISACRKKGKTVIYSVMPTRDGLISLQEENRKLMAQAEGEGLCKHFGIYLFDGFEAFKGIDSQSLIDFYWLKYDGHWNTGGSMHYALKLANWIFQRKVFLRK